MNNSMIRIPSLLSRDFFNNPDKGGWGVIPLTRALSAALFPRRPLTTSSINGHDVLLVGLIHAPGGGIEYLLQPSRDFPGLSVRNLDAIQG